MESHQSEDEPVAALAWGPTERALMLAAGSLLAVLLLLCLRISLQRAYAIDEFAYAHGAWLISEGAIPTLDFFETKFLLPLWVFASAFVIGGDDPHLILMLRALMWPFVGCVLVCVGVLARRACEGVPATAFFAPLLLASYPAFVNSSLEIRPDGVAIALFLAGLVVVTAREGRRGSAWLGGLLFGLALWASAKTAVYGAPLALFWLHDVARQGDPVDRRLVFRDPIRSALGVAGVAVFVLAYLFATGSAHSFYENAILHNQQFLIGGRWRPWQDDLVFIASQAPWVHIFAGIGLASTLRSLSRSESSSRGLTLVLSALLPSTLAAHILQQYPFLYSLQPFMALEAIFAGIGAATVLAMGRRVATESKSVGTRPYAAGIVLAGLLVGSFGSGRLYWEIGSDTLSEHHAVLGELERITEIDDPIYDNSGAYVARPHAYHLPWTDEPIRTLWADRLIREVPLAIDESDCVVTLIDGRFAALPAPLQAWIKENFRPYSGPIRLWGRDYRSPDGTLRDRFTANRAGHYRVYPAEIADEGGLTIDGRPIRSLRFGLEAGLHDIAYDGRRGGFRIQWSPEADAPQIAAHSAGAAH